MNKTNLLVDLGIFAAFVLVDVPAATGIPIHEWLGVALLATIVVHLLLHWDWVINVGKRFFRNLFQNSRLQFVIDAVLLVAFTLAMLSGLVISRNVLSVLGITLARNSIWTLVHSMSASVSLGLVALHFGMHWKWIVSMTKRYLVSPVVGLFKRSKPQAQPSLQTMKE